MSSSHHSGPITTENEDATKVSCPNSTKKSLAKKCALTITTIFIALLALASLLLFTHAGNILIWRQLSNALPALRGELTEGQLLSGWNIKNFRWQDSQITFRADNITFEWQPRKLFSRQLLVQRLEVKGVTLEIQTKTEETKPSELLTVDTTINIPLDILVNQINIQDINVIVSGTKISLETFKATAHLQNNQLFIQKALADNLQVVLTDPKKVTSSTKTQFPKKQDLKGIDLSTIALPEIKLPIPINLENFTLTNARYQQGDIDEVLEVLELSFNWQATHISSLKLRADQTRARILLSGEIQLSKYYPLELNLDATILDDFNISELAAIKGEKLSLEVSGDLAQLQLQLSTEGSINTTIKGNIGPFAPSFPLNIALKWSELQWPLPVKLPEFSASNGIVKITGDLNQYRLLLETSIKMAEQPVSHLSLNAYGSLDHLNIDELSLNPADANRLSEKPLNFIGNVSWKDGINWQGKINLSNLRPELWLPITPGVLNGKINTRFTMTDNSWQLNIPELNINGSLLNKALEVTGKLEVNSRIKTMAALPFNVNIHSLYATLGENRFRINGQIAERLSLKAKLDAKTLSELAPNVKGSLQGSLELTGSDEHPKLLFSFDSPSMDYQQTNINQLQIRGELIKTTLLEGNAHIGVRSLQHGDIQLNQLLLKARGNELGHQISFTTQGEPISGELLINGVWRGTNKSNEKWQGQLASARVITPVDNWLLEKPVTILLNVLGDVTLTKQCWLANPGKLCVDPSQFSANRGATRFQLSNFNLSNLNSFLPGNLTWQAILSSSGNIQWNSGHPTAHIQIQTTPGEITSNSDHPVSVKYQQLSTTISLNNNDLNAEFDFNSEQLGSAHVSLAVENMQNDQKLSGKARIQDMHLYFLQPLIPDIRNIDGVLSADTHLGGTLKAPLLFGNLKLSEGKIIAKQEMVTISSLTTELNVDGNKGEINGSMKVGDGDVKLSGHLDWQQIPPTGVIIMKGQNLGAKIPGILQLRASPDLKLTIGKTQTLTGNITIPWARVRIKQLPKQAITPSNDVVIITSETKETLMHAGHPFFMDVNIALGKDIKIDAYGLKSNLAGRLLLNVHPGKPMIADGSIQLINGRYHQFGQDLLIKEGNIIFSGPISSPYLAVNAIRNPENIEDNVIVGILVSGPPIRPEFSIYSAPSMSQQEQWSYLLRGHGFDEGDSSAVQSMLIGFWASQFDGAVTSIGEKFGFSDVTIDTQGSGDNTQVTIGGTIAPGLRVQYGAGVFDSIAEVKVRYELMPRLYLQAISGVARAIDLFYQFKIETGKKQIHSD